MRSRRLDKKLHRKWLDFGVIDASFRPGWREKLFAADIGEQFVIDSAHCEELDSLTQAAIKKYALQYKVSKVDANEAASWLSDEELVVFKFEATRHPSVALYTGNSPGTSN